MWAIMLDMHHPLMRQVIYAARKRRRKSLQCHRMLHQTWSVGVLSLVRHQ